MEQPRKEHVKYKLSAHIDRLCLSKQINFQTKITWKRNVNKVDTEIVTHENCQSVFDQLLELQLNLVYNAADSKFEPKLTEFAVTVIYKGKIKSGGHAKFDAAEIVNNNYTNQRMRLSLAQCPDPEAFIEVVFGYELIDESSRSLFNQLSMLNPMGFEQDLSEIDFQEEDERMKESTEMQEYGQRRGSIVPSLSDNVIQGTKTEENNEVESQKSQESPFKGKEIQKINNILDKFENSSRRFRESHKSFLHDDHNSTKNESLEVSIIPNENEERLKMRVVELQRQLQNRQELITEYQEQLDANRRYITQLQVKIQLLQQKQPSSHIQSGQGMKAIAQSESKYRFLYQKTLSELQEMKNSYISDANFSKQNLKFSNFVQQLNQIDEVPEFNNDHDNSGGSRVEELERQNVELQTKIASISHNIAQLFNAAYDYGGAKLLDYLQNSIGLIES